MSASIIADTTARTTRVSPRAMGRIAGASYLGIFIAGELYLLLIPNNGLFNNNDAATVDYIVSHQTAFWAGYFFFLLSAAFRLIQMLLFYQLFTPVNKRLALLAVYFNSVATTLQAVMAIALVVPLVLLKGQHSLTGFTPDQVHALAVAAMQLHIPIYSIALAFFGGYDLLIGYLAVTSTFIPRLVGVLMMITGLGWLTFFIPPLATQLSPFNVDAGAIGEVAMILWLLVMGVNAQRWKERASVAAASLPA
jgi:Domain of unknown function (DUF4386)